MCEVSPKRLVPKATSADAGKFVSIGPNGRPVLVEGGGGGGATEASEAQSRNPATTNSTTYISPRRLYNALDTFKTSEQTFTKAITFETAPNLSSVGSGLVLKTDDDGNVTGVSLTADDVTETADKLYITPAERSKLSALSITYVGTFATLEALEIAYPTGLPGYEAIVDGGLGEEPKKAFWDDSDNEWHLSSGGGASSFSELAGSPYDNPNLVAVFDTKQDSLGFVPEDIANKNTSNGYLGLNGAAKFSPIFIEFDPEMQLVTHADKLLWNSKQSDLGFVPENTENKNANGGYVGVDASGNVKLGGATSTGRAAFRGDGTNPIARFEDVTGLNGFTVSPNGQALLPNANNVMNIGAAHVSQLANIFTAGVTFTAANNYISLNSANGGTSLLFSVGVGNTPWGFANAFPFVFRDSGTTNGFTGTSGTCGLITLNTRVIPTSGNASFSLLQIAPTINQTGSANGKVRAIHVNPNIISAPNFVAIETNQRVSFGGANNNAMIGVRGDGINDIADFESITGNSVFKIGSDGVTHANQLVSSTIYGENITASNSLYSYGDISAGGGIITGGFISGVNITATNDITANNIHSNQDLSAANGIILSDRTTGETKRLFLNEGGLQTEEI